MTTLSADPPIALTLFGTFQLRVADLPDVKFRTNKSRALLAYLALARGQAVSRKVLTELLWDGYQRQSAQASLRQAIADLREIFAGFDLLHTDYHTVQLPVAPALWTCDALAFDALLAACDEHAHPALATCSLCQNRLRQALALYRGDLLANFAPVDSQPFVAWLENQRSHYAARAAQLTAALQTAPARRLGNLPPPLTPLIGRKDELSALADKLRDPVYRCLTLVGPGGIGKTRLALALGAQEVVHFPDGVWFVDLSALAPDTLPPADDAAGPPVHLFDTLAAAILAARSQNLRGGVRPTAQLLGDLQDRVLLLILDNFEHVSASAGFLTQILQQAPGVRLLVTSRHRLPLQSQLLHSVSGLSWPDDAAETTLPAADLVAQYPSVQLFLERAALTQAELMQDSSTLAAVVGICQMVEGVPLTLELAAALLDRYDLGAIARVIQDNYQVLRTDYQDLPPRQRSAQAVLQTTWQLLTAREASILARCAIFQGGFTLAAALAVADAAAADLQNLLHKSLLNHASTGWSAGAERYRMHELVRQFAASQLGQQSASRQSRDRHAAYYLALLASWQPADAAELAFRAAIQPDLENVEAAWTWALAADQFDLLITAAEGLAEFYEMTGAFYAVEALLTASVAQVRGKIAAKAGTDEGQPPVQEQLLLTILLAHLAYVYGVGLADFQRGRATAEEALTLAAVLNDPRLTVRSLHALSAITYGENEYASGQQLAGDGQRLAQSHGLRREEAMCLSAAGVNASARQDFGAALRYLTQAVTLAEQDNDTRKVLLYRSQLGICYRNVGDYGRALQCLEEDLPAAGPRSDPYSSALANANLGLLYLQLGDFAAAQTALEGSCQRFEELGERRLLTDCLAVLGQLFLQQGALVQATVTSQRALAQPFVSLSAQQVAWLTLGDIYRSQQDWPEAQDAYNQVIRVSEQPESVGIRLLAQGGLAAVLQARGEGAAAMSAIDELLAGFDPANFDGFFSAPRFLLLAYEILAAHHDPRAGALLQQAWQIVATSAEKISDPRQRSSFLTNVATHRKLGGLLASL